MVFGKQKRKLFFQKEDTLSNILILGNTRTGETHYIVKPTLRTWAGRVFVLDLEGELFLEAMKYRDGRKIKQIDIDAFDELEEYDVCDLIDNDIFIKFPIYSFDRSKEEKLKLICSQYLDYYLLNDKKVTAPTLFVLDNMEYFGLLENFREYLLSYKKNIKVCICLQSLSQVQYIYGKEFVDELISYCNTIAYLGSNSQVDINKISEIANIEPNEVAMLDINELWLCQNTGECKKINHY